MKASELIGQRYGRLTVIARAENTTRGNTQWICQCDCGNTVIHRASNLKSGSIKSCGCLRREVSATINYKHGMASGRHKTSIYNVWRGMKLRCFCTNNKDYHNYGGRGITICQEWVEDFQTFYDWAMANGYEDGLEIDRINNDGNYEPGNCRWVSRKENSRNRRTNKRLCYKGKTVTIAELSEISGIPIDAMRKRIAAGWSTAQAAETQLRGVSEGRSDDE